MAKPQIAASILSADFANLGQEVTAVLNAGADRIHVDVMDNHYVPNLTIGPLVVQALRNYGITAPLDVHLMVQPVDDLIPAFAKAGATRISFHPEASNHPDRTLQLILDHNVEAGIALNPGSPLNLLDYVLDKLSFVLLMSVNPGFGGQQFIPNALTKIAETKKLITAKNKKINIEVDGGVKADNIAQIAQAGADTFVMGSAIFNTKDYQQTLREIKANLSKA